jgi:hypothetical protein
MRCEMCLQLVGVRKFVSNRGTREDKKCLTWYLYWAPNSIRVSTAGADHLSTNVTISAAGARSMVEMYLYQAGSVR